MENVINEEEIKKSIDKIKNYKEQENIIFDNISDNFVDINYNYKTQNKEKLEYLQAEIINKFAIITKNHNNNILIIEKNLNKYIEKRKNVKQIFEKIDN